MNTPEITKADKVKGLMSSGMDFYSACMVLGIDSNDPEVQSVRFWSKEKPKIDLPDGWEEIFGIRK